MKAKMTTRGVNLDALGEGAPKVSEKEFMASVVALARLRGWKVYHTHDSRRSVSGFPDLVMVRGKRVLFVELKVAGGHPTESQYGWLRALAGAGLYAEVWHPHDWPEIERIFGEE